MPVVRYQENTREHTFRLGVLPFFTRIRRRVLSAKLEGRPLPQDAPTHLHQVAPQALMATLAVKQLDRDGNGDAGKETILLVPISTPATHDRLQGQSSRRRQRLAAGRSSPPYGYWRTRKEEIVPDPDAAPAIQLAFKLIFTFIAEGERTPWRRVAVELNAAGYVRQNDKPWTGKYVRTLTHTPLYAGYARSNLRGLGDIVDREADIKKPLVDLQTFLQAARLGHRATPHWLYELELMANADTKQKQRACKAGWN